MECSRGKAEKIGVLNMTQNEAIKELKKDIALYDNEITRLDTSIGTPDRNLIDALEMAIQALEKQAPKRVVTVERTKDFIEYVCPVCKKIIATEMIGEGYFGVHTPYCSGCGQRLYWSSVKKGEGTDETD